MPSLHTKDTMLARQAEAAASSSPPSQPKAIKRPCGLGREMIEGEEVVETATAAAAQQESA